MTEDEWQGCGSVHNMLRALRARSSRWRWSTRLSRLFACACCRRAWHVLTEPAQRQAVEVAERAADKQAHPPELAFAHTAATPIQVGVVPPELRHGHGSRGGHGRREMLFRVEFSPQREMLCNPARRAATPTPWGEPSFAANDARALLYFRAGADAAKHEQRAQCALLRDLAGPAGGLPAVKGAWLFANDGAVPKLARAIYEERAFDRLPILADALEDAGCAAAAILGHCRQAGEHARGCWVVDLVRPVD
jgi:hypothetical protein